jgi:hypothetical protein
MLSSFRDLLQVSGFIDIPVSFTIFNHHLIGNIATSDHGRSLGSNITEET